MTLVLTRQIPETKLSNNHQDNDFLNAFIHHNYDYFSKLTYMGITAIEQVTGKAPIAKGNDQYVGIHYECGPDKWGSVGMMNKMIKRGLITIAKDHRNNCYCLNATAKLVNKILANINRTIENIKCVKEGRYNDRKLNPCR
tara:strand:- start:1116 stop:1538 length:423 start_codon:yes stop_codon:yes gene_type:complete